LEIAPEKTEIVLFRGKKKSDVNPTTRVGRVYVSAKESIRYLGVLLDSQLNFTAHFRFIEDKVTGILRALSGLMPNLRGPSERRRRLYANVMSSVVLYGAPVWSGALLELCPGLRIIRRLQRRIAIRICAAYRTMSLDVALLLARLPPFEFMAEARATIYERSLTIIVGNQSNDELLKNICRDARIALRDRWKHHIVRRDAAGVRTKDAILPSMDAWIAWGGIYFHMTQLLSGHGCFDNYLYRIGKQRDTGCGHCSAAVDDAEHTFMWCPAWGVPRGDLCEVIGEDYHYPLSSARSVMTGPSGPRFRDFARKLCVLRKTRKGLAKWNLIPRSFCV